MKSKAKKNVTNRNDQQQNRIANSNETDSRTESQHLVDKPGAGGDDDVDAQNTQRQGSRSGRKSRDNFGSYNGY